MSREDSPNQISAVPEFAEFTPVDRRELMSIPELNQYIVQISKLMHHPGRFVGISYRNTEEPAYHSPLKRRPISPDPDEPIIRTDMLQPFTRIAAMFEWPKRNPYGNFKLDWGEARPTAVAQLRGVLARDVSFETIPPLYNPDSPRMVKSQSGEGVFLDTTWIRPEIQRVIRNTDYDTELGLIFPISARRIKDMSGDFIVFETKLARVGFDEKVLQAEASLIDVRWRAQLLACGDLADAPVDILNHFGGLYDAWLCDRPRTSENFESFKSFIGRTQDELAAQETLVATIHNVGRRKLLPTD